MKTPSHGAAPGRRNDLDWLRVLACYLLLVFHSVMIFNPAPFYHVRNDETSVAALVVAGFISLWHMPLLFLLAGWSAHASLAARGTRGFLRERVSKLLVPLVAGCAILVPPVKYVELRSGLDLRHDGLRVAPELRESFAAVGVEGLPEAPPFREGFLEFLPSFYTDLERFTWSHLWFLAYLAVLTLALLPLLRAWMRRGGAGPGRLAGAWAYAPLPLLVAVQAGLRPLFPGIYNLYDDGANLAWYATFLAAGFAMARVPAFEEALVRERGRLLGLALAAMLALLAALLSGGLGGPLVLAGTAVAGWGFVAALVGFARTHLAGVERGLDSLRDSAFPVYLLHQTAVALVGYAVVPLELGIAPKLVLVLGLSTAATLALYHLGLRRGVVLRRLAGMKPRPRRADPLARPAPVGA